MKLRRLAPLALLVLAVATPGGASAQEAEALAGYVGAAGGSGVSMRPVFPGLLPTGDAPFEVTHALTTASVKSGGVAFAQASLAWPGSAAAGLGPLLGTAAAQPFFSETIPPWPASVQASQDDGTVEAGAEPGPYMGAFGEPGKSQALAKGSGGSAPGVVTVDKVSSASRSLIENGKLVTEAVVVLDGVAIAGGVVGFDSIRSVSRATSDGRTGVTDGQTVVQGFTVAGRPAELTKDGVKSGDDASSVPGIDPTAAINQALTGAGITVEMAEATGSTGEGSADRVSSGVLVTVPNPAAAAHPNFVGSRFEISLAATAVSALASPPFAFEDFTGAVDVVAPVDTMAASGGSDVLGEAVSSVVAEGLSTVGGGTTGEQLAFEETSALGEVAGVPVGLVLALMSGGWLTATRMRKYGERFMVPEATTGEPVSNEE